MDRRRLHQSALLWALSACLPLAARGQTRTHSATHDGDDALKRVPVMRRPEDPSMEQASLGLRSLLEVAVSEALLSSPTADALRWSQRLRAYWDNGDWLTDPARRQASPWLQFVHFEAVAAEALKRCWPQAGPHLMLLVHSLDDGDLRQIVADATRRPEDGHWATLQLERRVGGRVHSRLLGEVLQVQLEWLKAHQDRYPQRPVPRDAQVEVEHYECCQRITRAIVDTVFVAIALQEQRWRGMPLDDLNVSTHIATLVAVLGPAPEKLPFPIRERLRPTWLATASAAADTTEPTRKPRKPR